jgi:hypothetical protein
VLRSLFWGRWREKKEEEERVSGRLRDLESGAPEETKA